MLKFTLECECHKQPAYGIGLTVANLVDLLVAGRVMTLNLADQGGPDVRIAIIADADEAALVERLKTALGLDPHLTMKPPESGMTEVVRIDLRGS